jgi:hypothetical protein
MTMAKAISDDSKEPNVKISDDDLKGIFEVLKCRREARIVADAAARRGEDWDKAFAEAYRAQRSEGVS